MILKTHYLITWILIKKDINSRDLAKVCNFIRMSKLMIPPKGWILFTKKYITNRRSKDGRLRLLDRIASF